MTKNRPKIPRKLENSIYYLSAKTCCVCRQRGLPIQLHHIDENPSNNSEENLIVLCASCHDEAHTKHALSKNLTPDKLKHCKGAWKEEVKELSAKAMLPQANLSQAMWTYVNHQRLPHIMKSVGADFDQYLYELLLEDKVIDKLGIPSFHKMLI